ncbi:PAS domain-containing protein [Pedobacter sp. SYP-B3415]|uniref:PAS domain-containing protein n=1 Tax=Pedobacter sp. SYP-B3415 TaxID=2496641 RepID=UPI00101D2984|nr:PAS domain-containing protein [Pedobacter sp. SYP-B3415]
MKPDLPRLQPGLRDRPRHALLSYWDKDLVCRFANAGLSYWFGETPDNAVGKTTLKTLLGAGFEQHAIAIESVMEGYKETQLLEMEVGSGKTIIAEASYFPDSGEQEISGFFLCLTESEEQADGYMRYVPAAEQSKFGPVQGTRECMLRVSRYLQDHILSEFPTIKEIAKAHLISSSKLMRDFRLVFHTSPHEYYRDLQMEFAERHMKETGCSKKTMALMLGFSNPTNFNSRYRRYLEKKMSETVKTDPKPDLADEHEVLLVQAPVALAILDVDRHFLMASEKWISDFHPDHRDVTGKSFFEFFPEGNVPWPGLRDDRQPYLPQKTLLKDKYGRQHLLSLSVKPWTDHTGRPVGSIICATEHVDS